MFKEPEVVEGVEEVKQESKTFEINYRFDPKTKEYRVRILRLKSKEEFEILTDVTLFDFFTTKSHIDDVLKREGCNP